MVRVCVILGESFQPADGREHTSSPNALPEPELENKRARVQLSKRPAVRDVDRVGIFNAMVCHGANVQSLSYVR